MVMSPVKLTVTTRLLRAGSNPVVVFPQGRRDSGPPSRRTYLSVLAGLEPATCVFFSRYRCREYGFNWSVFRAECQFEQMLAAAALAHRSDLSHHTDCHMAISVRIKPGPDCTACRVLCIHVCTCMYVPQNITNTTSFRSTSTPAPP